MSETDKAVAEVIKSAGDVAPELWVSMVEAERLGSAAAMVLFFLTALGLACGSRFCWKQKKIDPGGDWYAGSVVVGFFAFLALTISVFWIDDAIYPEAAVVRSVLGVSP